MEKTVDKLNLFCCRMINLGTFNEKNTPTSLYRVCCLMEEIADDYKSIRKISYNNRSLRLTRPLLNLLKETNTLFRSFYSLYHKYDEDNLMEFKENSKNLWVLSEKFISKEEKHVALVGCHIRSIISKIHHLGESVMILPEQVKQS